MIIIIIMIIKIIMIIIIIIIIIIMVMQHSIVFKRSCYPYLLLWTWPAITFHKCQGNINMEG